MPDLSASVDDADFLAWLHENNTLTLDQDTAARLDPEVRKKYTRYLQELEARKTRPRSNSLLPEARSRSDSTISTSSGSGSAGSSDGKREMGPIKSLVHVLHLDRGHRKKEKKLKKAEEARLKEEMDMEQWNERLKLHHERKLERRFSNDGRKLFSK